MTISRFEHRPDISIAGVSKYLEALSEDRRLEVYNRLPRHLGLKAWSGDPGYMNATSTAGPGVIRLSKCLVPVTFTLAKAWAAVGVASSAENANTFLGAYTVSGDTATLVAKTADQSVAFRAAGSYGPDLVVEAGQSLVVAGGDNVFMYWAFLQGTAGVTPLQLTRGISSTGGPQNGALVAADGLNSATSGSLLTALPATIALSAMTAGTINYFGAFS